MAHLTNFSFEFFYKIFTEDASQPLLYHGAKKVKNDQKLKLRGPAIRQDPLEAILVIFGRRALIFFWKLLEKMKNDTTLYACAVVITLETQKCRKRAPRSVEFNFFINCDRHKRFSQNERRWIDLQNFASMFLIFAWGLSYDLSKFSDDFTPFFLLWKTITIKVPRQKLKKSEAAFCSHEHDEQVCQVS